MDDNLKRCPCCASKARSRELESGPGLVFCPACHLTTDWCDSLEEAISKWNTREENAERKPCPVCGYLRMNGELVEPPTEESSPAVPPDGHWEVVWVDRSVSTTGRTLWQNPLDATYTATRGDDA